MLHVGEDVGQDLARVVLVGESVDDRHPRGGGEALDDVLLEGAHHDDVAHPRDHLGGIIHRLAAAQLRIPRVHVDGGTAQLQHAGLEGQAGAGGGLLEDHHQRTVLQRMPGLVVLEALLDEIGAFQQVFDLFAAEVVEFQEVLDGQCAHGRGCRVGVDSGKGTSGGDMPGEGAGKAASQRKCPVVQVWMRCSGKAG